MDNPQEYGKITELWKAKKPKKKEKSVKPKKLVCKKEVCHSQKTTTNSGEQSNNNSKIKFFETFDQMTQHMKEKTKQKPSISEVSNKIKKKKKRKMKKHSQESSDKKSTRSRKKKNLKSNSNPKNSLEKKKSESQSNSETRKKRQRKNSKIPKKSTNHKNLLKQNLEDHHLKKIQFLTDQIEQQNKTFQQYSNKAKEVIRTQILQNEKYAKEKRRRYLRMAKERLGEYMLRGGMSKTKEVWVDGGVMKDVKDRLQKVKIEKEHREKFKKTLKRRKTGVIMAEEINSGELVNNKDSKYFFG